MREVSSLTSGGGGSKERWWWQWQRPRPQAEGKRSSGRPNRSELSFVFSFQPPCATIGEFLLSATFANQHQHQQQWRTSERYRTVITKEPLSSMAGVSPSGDSIAATSSTRGSSGGSRNGAGAFMQSESCERPIGLNIVAVVGQEGHRQGATPTPIIRRDHQQQQRTNDTVAAAEEGMNQHNVGPVDQLLQLVDDGQSLSRRVLGNERQSARLGERLSALKTPLWQLQARVRTQGERPPEFIFTLAKQVSHCLDVLLELTHPDWWNQIRRKVGERKRERGAGMGERRRKASGWSRACSLLTWYFQVRVGSRNRLPTCFLGSCLTLSYVVLRIYLLRYLYVPLRSLPVDNSSNLRGCELLSGHRAVLSV